MLLVKKEGLIYEVAKVKVHDSRTFSLMCHLELICGWDYVNPDFSDQQGWISPNMFIEDVQDEYFLVCYDESIKERLEEEGFEFIEKLPYIHVVKIDF